MTCANCGAPAEPGQFCGACGALQPPAPGYGSQQPQPGAGGPYSAAAGAGPGGPGPGCVGPPPYSAPYGVPGQVGSPSTFYTPYPQFGGVFICPLAVILGPIFGFVARGQIRRSNGAETGSGLALAGIIVGLSLIAICAAIFSVLVLVGTFASSATNGTG